MIRSKIIKNQKINIINITEILFYAFPLSFIIGNLALNLHLLLFIITSLFLIKKKQFTVRFDSLYWIFIVFCLYLFLLTIIQYHSSDVLSKQIKTWSFESQPVFKSFIFVRFIILIFIIDTLFLNKILNIKKLFFFSLFCTSFVSFDVILQYATGSDIFGYKNFEMWNSGPFGNEYIAGGYLQKFSFISFFYLFLSYSKKKIYIPLSIFFITIHLVAILLAGNRMPMILTLFGCGLLILFIKNIRFIMALSLISFLSIFFIIADNDTRIKKAYVGFFNDVNVFNLFEFNKTEKKEKKITVTHRNEKGEKTEWSEGIWKKNWKGITLLQGTGYNRVFRTAIKVWEEQPIFGFGLKSFRIKCWEVGPKNKNLQPVSQISIFSCSNHPHNYYLELLSETGMIGTILIVIFFIFLLKKAYYHLRNYNKKID